MSLELLDGLHESVRFSMARLTQGHEVFQPVCFAVIGVPTKRRDMVHVLSGRPAGLARLVVSGARLSFLSHPIRAAVMGDSFAFMLRVQGADSIAVAAVSGAILSAPFLRGDPFSVSRKRNPAAKANKVNGTGLRSRSNRRVLTRFRAMEAPAMTNARWISLESSAAMVTDKLHGKDMGWC